MIKTVLHLMFILNSIVLTPKAYATDTRPAPPEGRDDSVRRPLTPPSEDFLQNDELLNQAFTSQNERAKNLIKKQIESQGPEGLQDAKFRSQLKKLLATTKPEEKTEAQGDCQCNKDNGQSEKNRLTDKLKIKEVSDVIEEVSSNKNSQRKNKIREDEDPNFEMASPTRSANKNSQKSQIEQDIAMMQGDRLMIVSANTQPNLNNMQSFQSLPNLQGNMMSLQNMPNLQNNMMSSQNQLSSIFSQNMGQMPTQNFNLMNQQSIQGFGNNNLANFGALNNFNLGSQGMSNIYGNSSYLCT